ncbi:hypothetical protein [Pontibacter sp. BAB1700]|uniref:hypothetical protein n=1 Tax=Pontibacter sp. BAB1700 TaxID=1144253 RepID=UPI00026BD9E7|nr:hypothetical protein [Pontibacter sp. BAB1700]EJF10009.1 hypothetical protein O71_11559 [Pontibacter sp. BAB1700]
MINMDYLYQRGSFCYTQQIGGKEYYVTLALGLNDIRPAYIYMLSMKDLPERIPVMVEQCIKPNGAGQADVCVIEYLAEDGVTIMQLKHLDITVEELHTQEPESVYAGIPLLTYDQFMQVLEHKQ